MPRPVPRLTAARGLPGSGKTTWAMEQKGAVRVTRDRIREDFNITWDYRDRAMEDLVTEIQDEMIVKLLCRGWHVIVDDTNLEWKHIARLQELAATAVRHLGVTVDFAVKEFLHVPLELCIERDAKRPAPVGEEKIRAMYEKLVGDGEA